MREAKMDHQRRTNNSKGAPQDRLADLVVALSQAVKDKCTTAAFMLKRMLCVIAQQADNGSPRFAVDPLKANASSRPDLTDQRGVRRSEAVVRALSEGIVTTGTARSGRETARTVHHIDSREMSALENQTTTQYRACTKRKFDQAFGPFGSQNDGARLGNPASPTDLYVIQNYNMKKAATLPNQVILVLEVNR